ncbi:site-specific integrase [Microbispora sp. NPDC049633]|uniref:tyrosine-type recombinase/integrase n=1 Tax=Microbispora sp. NPDC049633 TaxID=3154355 RepID=UPI0034369614
MAGPRRKLLYGMGSIKKVATCKHKTDTCSCKWEARFRDLTGTPREKTFDDWDRAYDELFDLYEKKRQGKGRASKAKGRPKTFQEYADEWLKSMRHLGATSLKQYRSALNVHAYPAFGNVAVTKVTKDMIGRLIDDMYEVRIRDFDAEGRPVRGAEPRPVYEGTVKILIQYVLRPIFRQVATDGWRTDNPADGHRLVAVTQTRRFLPTMEQIHAIAHAIDPYFRLAVYLMVGAGLREGEALGASLDCVREDRLWLYRQWRHDAKWGPLKYMKENQGRNVPMDPFLKAEIDRHVAEFGVGAGGLFFASPKIAGRPVNNSVFDRALREACVRLGYDDLDITAHNFRHAFASYMIMNGVELGEVSKMLGHKSYQTTYEVYFDLLTPTWAKVARAANGFLSKGTEKIADVKGVNAYAEEERQERIQALLAELKDLGAEVALLAV